MRSIFIFTTNSRVRGERMTDRECIIEYERGNPSEEEREASRLAVGFIKKFECINSDFLSVFEGQRLRSGCCPIDHGIWAVHTK